MHAIAASARKSRWKAIYCSTLVREQYAVEFVGMRYPLGQYVRGHIQTACFSKPQRSRSLVLPYRAPAHPMLALPSRAPKAPATPTSFPSMVTSNNPARRRPASMRRDIKLVGVTGTYFCEQIVIAPDRPTSLPGRRPASLMARTAPSRPSHFRTRWLSEGSSGQGAGGHELRRLLRPTSPRL